MPKSTATIPSPCSNYPQLSFLPQFSRSCNPCSSAILSLLISPSLSYPLISFHPYYPIKQSCLSVTPMHGGILVCKGCVDGGGAHPRFYLLGWCVRMDVVCADTRPLYKTKRSPPFKSQPERYKTLEYPTGDGKEEEMAKELPVDVITNILSRIPVKGVFRFRCVSKIWFRLLSGDTHFNKLHSDRQTEDPNEGVVVLSLEKQQLCYACDYTACDKAVKFDIPFADQSSTARYLIYGICNGLICLSNSATQKFSNVYIWNPLTRDHITIPCPPIPSRRSLSTVFVFGFYKTVDNEYKYKVVRIAWTPNTSEPLFESHVSVYTLGSDSWRSVGALMYNYNITLHKFSRPPLVNGALHWVSSRPSTSIVSFDIEDEVFRLLPRPNAVRYNHTYEVKVVELGGLLCLIIFPDPCAIEIWSMNEYGVGESWIKQFQCRPGSWAYLKVCLASNDKIVAIKDLSELVLLKLDPFSITTLKGFEVKFYSMFSYKGSLVSPKNYQWSHSHDSGAKRKRSDDCDEEHV